MTEENKIQINGGIMINVDVSVKSYTWNPGTRSCKSGKYLANIFDHSVITCDENIKEKQKLF